MVKQKQQALLARLTTSTVSLSSSAASVSTTQKAAGEEGKGYFVPRGQQKLGIGVLLFSNFIMSSFNVMQNRTMAGGRRSFSYRIRGRHTVEYRPTDRQSDISTRISTAAYTLNPHIFCVMIVIASLHNKHLFYSHYYVSSHSAVVLS